MEFRRALFRSAEDRQKRASGRQWRKPLNCRKRPGLQALCRGSGLRRGGELGRGEGDRRFRARIRIESIQLPDSSPPSPWWRDARRGSPTLEVSATYRYNMSIINRIGGTSG